MSLHESGCKLTSAEVSAIMERTDGLESCPIVFAAVCSAIAKLPANVQEFALQKCTFIAIGKGTHGESWPASYFCPQTDGGEKAVQNQWVIILNETAIHKQREYVIAHEVAHAWLEHDLPLRQDDYRLREFDADELAKSWGFTIPRLRRKTHQIERETLEQNQQDDASMNFAKHFQAKALADRKSAEIAD